ncbi:MAG: hypothetical protein JJT89_02405 [Nitriliruptoraceae bacterium]|nr:hypothetical protein [Nitriliruptoraceae bacterium]
MVLTAQVGIDAAAVTLVVASPTPGGWFTARGRRRLVLNSGRAIARDGQLGPGMLALLDETCARLQTAAFGVGAGSVTTSVASSLRVAEDLEQLLAIVADRLGGPVTVLTEEQEARALLLAARATIGPPPVRGASIPVGAGPAEVVLALDADRIASIRDVGTGVPERVATDGGVRGLLPTERVDPFHPSVRGHVERHAQALAARLPVRTGWPVVTGEGPRALARTLLARRRGARRSVAAGGLHATRGEVASIVHELAAAGPTARLLLPAIAPDEVDLVAVTATLLTQVLTRLGATGARFSDVEVLDGLIAGALERPVPVDPDEVRAGGLEDLAALGGFPAPRMEAFARHAVTLLEAEHHPAVVDPAERALLDLAARLVMLPPERCDQVRASGIRGVDPMDLATALEVATVAGMARTGPARRRRDGLAALLVAAQRHPDAATGSSGSGPRPGTPSEVVTDGTGIARLVSRP